MRLAGDVGFAAIECEELGVVVRELAANVLIHAGEGDISIVGTSGEIRIETRDRGPGIPSIEQAVSDGYSTAGSLGYGLGTVNRLTDGMTITSVLGGGTTVSVRRRIREPLETHGHSPVDIGVVTLPKPGYRENGDSYVVRSWGRKTLVGVIDGVGHGSPAQAAALAAREYVQRHYDQPLVDIFRGTGIACRGTRGVVMALARFDHVEGLLEFASVGNIETRVFNAAGPTNFIVRRGIVGVNAPLPKVTSHAWPPDAALVMHSDGIATHWGTDDFAEFADTPSRIQAHQILNTFGRRTDDATVLVVKPARP